MLNFTNQCDCCGMVQHTVDVLTFVLGLKVCNECISLVDDVQREQEVVAV